MGCPGLHGLDDSLPRPPRHLRAYKSVDIVVDSYGRLSFPIVSVSCLSYRLRSCPSLACISMFSSCCTLGCEVSRVHGMGEARGTHHRDLPPLLGLAYAVLWSFFVAGVSCLKYRLKHRLKWPVFPPFLCVHVQHPLIFGLAFGRHGVHRACLNGPGGGVSRIHHRSWGIPGYILSTVLLCTDIISIYLYIYGRTLRALITFSEAVVIPGTK